jgi:hypothetical protein
MFILPHLKALTTGNLGSAVFKNAGLDLKFADNKSLVDSVTGNSLISFTRASGGTPGGSGTFIDSNGVLQSAVTNLLLNSEDFSAATWTRSNLTPTTDAVVAPNGTTTADALLETTASTEHVIYATSTQTFTTGTQSIYVKPNGRTNAALRFYNANNDWHTVVFNLTGDGSATQSSAGSSSGFSAVSSSIVNVGNGWYRISMTATQSSRATYPLSLDFCTTSTPTLDSLSGAEFYTGDITKGVFLWGAQFQDASTVGDYVPTTSAISSAPRFDHRITSSTTNLCLYSQAVSTAPWVSNGTETCVASTLTDPAGGLNAFRINLEPAIPSRWQQPITVVNGAIYTLSAWVRSTTGTTQFRLRF